MEGKYPELKKTAKNCQEIIDCFNRLSVDASEYYDAARSFWGKTPPEIYIMKHLVFNLYKRLCEVDEVAPAQNETPSPRAWLPMYVERLYAEGKTQQEIAIDLRRKEVPLTVITALLREEEGFLGDYRQWVKKKGWFKGEQKESEE